MIRYTTPTLPLQLEGIDLSFDCDVYVTFEQNCIELTKTGNDLTITYDSEEDVSNISVTLTQAETAMFLESGKKIEIQVNWIFSNGTKGASGIGKLPSKKNLLEKVINYGDQT